MFGSPAAPEDLNLPFSMAPSKQGKGGDAGFGEHPQGLLRYRSAPSSLLGDLCGEVVLPARSSSPETEAVLARFVSGRIAGNSPAAAPGRSQFTAASEQGASQGLQFPSSSSQIAYHSQPRIPSAPPASSFRVVTAMSGDKETAPARGGVGSSSLIRQTGLVSHLGMENGFDMIRSMGGFRHGSCSGGEAAVVGNRLTGQISFSSRQSAAAASALMSQIPEVGDEGLDHSSPDDGALNGNNGGAYIPGYPVASWDDPSLFSGTFDGLKGPRDPPQSQNGDIRSHFSSLTHHLSLPTSSPETAAVLQFQDAVPCKVRAKRGCATHPRSIAERVRRTRISERMRKLQELVPNMEKQTNTADMLDLAVDYIKDLQKRVESLSESKASCTCSCGRKTMTGEAAVRSLRRFPDRTASESESA